MLEVKPITLARLLDQLAKAGLVARRADPGDRRAYRIFLTPATAPHLESVEAVAASVRADALRSLNRQEITALFSALRTIRDNLASH
ncbi:MAG: MarR family transcriptional regulator [Thiobacillus sp.]|nr:MarR family transcriptional regulator [Thiobacillus sp.]